MRTNLSRRAQRLVAEGFLRKEIVEQVSAFANQITPSAPTAGSQPVSIARPELGIALDASDFFHDEYRAFVQLRNTSVPIDDDALVGRKLASMVPDHDYIVFLVSQTGDYWTLNERDALVGSGDSLLIVARGNGMQRARAVLEGLSTPGAFSEASVRPLGRSLDFRVCVVTLLAGSPTLRVRS